MIRSSTAILIKGFKLWDKRIIVLMFSILPLIDTLNGLINLPIGIVYKGFLCIVLAIEISKRRAFYRKYILIIAISLVYVLFSITINMLLGGQLNKFDFAVKLLFNISLLCLLQMCIKKKIIDGKSIWKILHNSSWIFILCFLGPYMLGKGRTVYIGDIGYKAFFISQNELGLLVTALIFFSSFCLLHKFSIFEIVKLVLLFLCGMLLNTKSAILASIFAIALWLLPVILKGSAKAKLLSIIVIISGGVVFRDRIIKTINNACSRYAMLISKHYNGSNLAGVLSGRNNFVKKAIGEFIGSHTGFKMLFGNGFCSNVLVEMDILDIFFYLGLFGAIAIVAFLLFILFKTWNNAKRDYSRIRPISFVIIIGMLTFAGHIIFMSMAGCYFVLYICFLVYFRRDIQPKKMIRFTI